MKKQFAGLALGVMCLIGIQGCGILSSDKFSAMDGSAGSAANEVASMGDAASGMLDPLGLAKELVTTDSSYIERNVSWSVSSNGGIVRTASVSSPRGTISRIDTIWFKDVAGAILLTPRVEAVGSFRHVRYAKMTGMRQNSYSNVLDMSVTISRTAVDTTFEWPNGTITGSYNDEVMSQTNVTGVKRQWKRGTVPHLQFPSAGTISIARPLRSMVITFDGDSTATVVAKRIRDDATRTFTVNLKTGEEQE